MQKLVIILVCYMIMVSSVYSQVTGGNNVFSSLSLSNSPMVTALGGMSVANPSGDVNLAVQNPALLSANDSNQFSINFFGYYAKTNMTSAIYANKSKKWKTNYAFSTVFNNYGTFVQTDEYGNIQGSYSALDYAFCLSTSRRYLNRWHYGSNLKLAGANYNHYTSAALLLDLGVYYEDTAKNITFGMTFKNIGFQMKKFNPGNPAEPLPFDLQMGFAKKFEHLPFRFQMMGHHLYQWNIRYNNPADTYTGSVIIGQDNTNSNKSYFFDKLFRHFVFAGEILLSKHFDLIVSYNHLRRAELAIPSPKGMSGFAFGFNLKYKKWELSYAKSVYNQVGGTNHVGLNLFLSQF